MLCSNERHVCGAAGSSKTLNQRCIADMFSFFTADPFSSLSFLPCPTHHGEMPV